MRNSTSHCLLLRPHFIHHAPSAATAKQPQHHHENNIITPKCVCLPPSTHSRIVLLLLLWNPHPSTHDGTPKSGRTLWLAFVVGLPRSLNPNGDIFRAVICARIIVIYESERGTKQLSATPLTGGALVGGFGTILMTDGLFRSVQDFVL